MKYLLYREKGFEKKYPIVSKSFKIGREESCDLAISNNLISREHLKVRVFKSFIRVTDIESANGIFVNGVKKETADIKIGESFRIGEIEFVFLEGYREDFLISEDMFRNSEPDSFRKKTVTPAGDKTETLENIFTTLEENLSLSSGSFHDFSSFFSFLNKLLSETNDLGSFFFIMNQKNNFEIKFSINSNEESLRKILFLMDNDPEVLRQKKTYQDNFLLSTTEIHNGYMSVIHFPGGICDKIPDKAVKFTNHLSRELELISVKLLNKKKGSTPTVKGEGKTPYITNNKEMKILLDQLIKIARSDINILIRGESGVGKELFARIIHDQSDRADKNFVAINCAAIPEHLLESELYGYEKGAFTGADKQLKGKLEIASGGTLVLDEIGDMPLPLQAKLLRAIQEQEFYRLGGSFPIKVDLRIVSLTHMDLHDMINKKKFREDLYYRIVHRSITIPPLRERREDIIALTNYFTAKSCSRNNKHINGYSVKAYESLLNYDWPGNIRQLENEINSIIRLLDDGEIVDASILSEEIRGFSGEKEIQSESSGPTEPVSSEKKVFFKKPDKKEIIEVLEKNRWNKSKSAKDLNMTYQGLHKKMKKLKIKTPAVD